MTTGGNIVSGRGLVVSETEYRLLEALRGKVKPGFPYTVEDLSKMTGLPRSSVEAVVSLLAGKGVVEVARQKRRTIKLSDEGRRYLEQGFPEERLARLLAERGGRLSLSEAVKELGENASIAIANALKLGMVRKEGGNLVLAGDTRSPHRVLLEKILRGESLSDEELKALRRRRLVDVEEETETKVVFREAPEEVLSRASIEVGALLAEHLETGLWRRLRLRKYDVTAQPPQIIPHRPHYFVEFLETVRDAMIEMGFVEVEFPAVELELWNYDVLFQPQYHPARSPTDTFYLEAEEDAYEVPSRELIDRVKHIHERGWGYRWDPRIAMRLILRSHTTAVSARVLHLGVKPPFRVFTIGRVYRVEKVDPKHLPEFHQLDGIAAEDGITFRDLLGLLAEFFERLGIREYRFRLAYFPFTEPSAEAYVRIRDEWLEVLGCGLFRPEVLEALGVDYPVAAWGMGLERVAMAIYGLSDIRDLYTFDVNRVREFNVRWETYARAKV